MIQRIHIVIRGAVQGVGFRPFVYRLAGAIGLPGWVSNSTQGVIIEAEGDKPSLDSFLLRIEKEKPPLASVQSLEYSYLDPAGFSDFQIRPSQTSGAVSALILPDIATCPDCRKELFDPANRRYLYPFTNCTNCGPRFTIIEALPYDRPNTSMKAFPMCDACRAEYENPNDRRFHAQPNACPRCGPSLALWNPEGVCLSQAHDAVLAVAQEIRDGRIVALKGMGGFQLLVDARNDGAVTRLRQRKHRDEKPLALMYPSMEALRHDCELSELEERLLLSAESPIVLLQRKEDVSSRERCQHSSVAPSVAPHNPYLGAMLPYTPLHHILMNELEFPVVATSGNLSDEPICIDEREALSRLHDIADVFLVHNRPIVRHVDDSVLRVMMGRELVLRRARGYTPLPITVQFKHRPVVAVGAHLKNTIAVSFGNNEVFISQHIGDLETPESLKAFARVIHDLPSMYHISAEEMVCDLHPDYLSSKFALASGKRVSRVQHHFAHAASCMAENGLIGPVLAVSWDGTGYGPDGTIWGGEFLTVSSPKENSWEDPNRKFHRLGSFRTFRLPGGEQAIKEPRRTAIGLLYEIFGDGVLDHRSLASLASLTAAELSLLQQMLQKGVNSPVTSSAGRLFDAVASIVGVRQTVRYEGQAAMELEFAIASERSDEAYPFAIEELKSATTDLNEKGTERGLSKRADVSNPHLEVPDFKPRYLIDWQPTVEAILRDLGHSPVSRMAARFHNSLAEMVVEMAQRSGDERVVLSGGCFQNRYLTERTVARLTAAGFRPYWHQRVPPNDGGIALGQIAALAF